MGKPDRAWLPSVVGWINSSFPVRDSHALPAMIVHRLNQLPPFSYVVLRPYPASLMLRFDPIQLCSHVAFMPYLTSLIGRLLTRPGFSSTRLHCHIRLFSFVSSIIFGCSRTQPSSCAASAMCNSHYTRKCHVHVRVKQPAIFRRWELEGLRNDHLHGNYYALKNRSSRD